MSKENVHYLHFRKCGGTAFKNAVHGHIKEGRFNILLHGHDVKIDHIPYGEKFIFFLRDPIAKFVSGFYDRKREGRPGYYFPHWEHEKRLFGIFETPNELGEALNSDDDALKADAEEAMTTIPHIMNSFWEWLDGPVTLMSRRNDILYVGQQETFQSDFENLKRLLELPQIEISRDPAKANSAPTGEDKILSEKAKTNLTNWYASDYQLFDVLRFMGKIPA